MIQFNNPTDAANWLKINVTGELHTDSRHIHAGDGFIAWPGAAVDGRQFVSTALQQGASVCLVEQSGSEEHDFGNVETKDKVASYRCNQTGHNARTCKQEVEVVSK